MVKPIDSWETIVKATDLSSRSMKHVEIKEKEITVINLDGKY
jgi:hypothetical protein